MKGKIAIFIPTYNERSTISDVLSRVPGEILGHKTEIVVSDDCSTDGTAAIALTHVHHLITSQKNCGVGATTKKGLGYIAELPDIQFVIKFDGDGQHVLGFLADVVRYLERGDDLVICSRFHPVSDQAHTPIDRMLLNGIFTEMMRKITGWNITDARSGYMGIQFHHVLNIHKKLITEGYGIPMELILRIWNDNPDAHISEIPHPALYGPNAHGKLQDKYSFETVTDKANRLTVAYEALLHVIEDLKIPRERILEMNGFAHHAI